MTTTLVIWKRSAVSIVLLVAGCGGQTNTTTPTAAPASPTDFPEALAHAICKNVGPCCAQSKRPFTEKNCEDVLGKAYEGKLDTFTKNYDRTAAQNCLNAIGTSASECNFSSSSAAATACNSVAGSSAGRAKLGEPCDTTCVDTGGSTSCFSGAYISVSSDGGVTRSPSVSGSCFMNDGLFCDGNSNSCATQHSIGSACLSNEECKDGFCGENGTCSPKSKEGGQCTSDDACADGLFCDGSSCARLRGPGESCTDFTQCADGTCNQGTCTDSSAGLLSVFCVP
jgi:hypothetical protein